MNTPAMPSTDGKVRDWRQLLAEAAAGLDPSVNVSLLADIRATLCCAPEPSRAEYDARCSLQARINTLEQELHDLRSAPEPAADYVVDDPLELAAQLLYSHGHRASATEVRKAARDAERYRHIRDIPHSGSVSQALRLQQNSVMDEVIDASMGSTALTKVAQQECPACGDWAGIGTDHQCPVCSPANGRDGA